MASQWPTTKHQRRGLEKSERGTMAEVLNVVFQENSPLEGARLTFLAIWNHAKVVDGTSFAGQQTLAKEIGRCKRTVQNDIAFLVEQQFIFKESPVPGSQRSNTYTINAEKFAKLEQRRLRKTTGKTAGETGGPRDC